jgi:hypothetical protein
MLPTQSGGAKVMPKNPITPGTQRAIEVIRARSDRRVADLAPIIAELQANGVTSLRRIAKALNERGVPTMAGPGPWHHTQVEKLLARLKM